MGRVYVHIICVWMRSNVGAKGIKGVHHIRAYLGDVFTHMYVGERGGRKVRTRTQV